MKRFVPLLLALIAGPAFAQTVTVPGPTTYNVALSWTAPVDSTGAALCTVASPCTYNVYRVPGTTTITVGTTGATLVNAAPVSAVTATDANVANGQTYSYAVETVQGGQTSVPSNTANVTIPKGTSAPTGTTATRTP